MRYKVVIFDLDGTLIDSLEDLGTAVNHALEQKGFPRHAMAQYRQMVGHGVRNLVMQALPEALQADETLIDECLKAFKDYYTTHIDVHTRPYPGMVELLLRLHGEGVLLAVASNKFQSGTEYLVRRFFGKIPFVAILGNREGYPLKPDPGIVAEVLRKAGGVVATAPSDSRTAGVTDTSSASGLADTPSASGLADTSSAIGPTEAVLVGDSLTDMKTAWNGGIRGIAVSWGYRVMQASENLTVVHSADELWDVLAG